MPVIKNFPHQYNDLQKLRSTIQLYAQMLNAGGHPDRDEEFGYQLARERIYRFRSSEGFTPVDYSGDPPALDRAIRRRIAEEVRKPASTQGARTAAREMRATMRLLGWIDTGGGLTNEGRAVLATTAGGPDELAEVRAVMGITVTGPDGSQSHPARVLLRLIDEHRFASRSGMELALAARDDSASAYAEVSVLARLTESERTKALDANPTKMANAVKILPSFLVRTGLVAQGGDGRYFVTSKGEAALQRDGAYGPVSISDGARRDGSTGRRPGGTRRSRPRPSSRDSVGRRPAAGDARRLLTAEEQEAAARLLLERTERHQQLVRQLAELRGTAAMYEDEFSYDLLFEPSDGPLILWEVKSIQDDMVSQVRRAAEQLPYYEWFHVAPHWPGREVIRAALLESAASDELCDFLEQEHRIGAMTFQDGELVALNPMGRHVLRRLGQLAE